MQRWEYMTWLAQVTEDRRGRISHRNYEELPDWQQGPGVFVQLCQAGDEGWELVQVDYSAHNAGVVEYFFKRPRPEPR